MNFDDFINEQYNHMGIIQEGDTNVIQDFIKTIKHIRKGGKPSKSPVITLKDPLKLKKLATITSPTYEEAKKHIEADKDSTDLKYRIVYNVNSILNANASSGGSLDIRLQDLTGTPYVRYGDSKGKSSKLDDAPPTFQELRDTALQILTPAIESKILKWDEFKELSRKDIINRGVDKSVGLVKDFVDAEGSVAVM